MPKPLECVNCGQPIPADKIARSRGAAPRFDTDRCRWAWQKRRYRKAVADGDTPTPKQGKRK